MGDKTGIAWCDHTFNPWIGCTKVSTGCANCYAERDNKRYSWVSGWGQGQPRRLTSATNWKKPLEWARLAAKEGKIKRVFCASLADIFDSEVSQEWREALWALIDETRQMAKPGAYLEWLLLTKRHENIPDMIRYQWRTSGNAPFNVRLGVTAENQEQWDNRVSYMTTVWEGKNFVSVEPMLGAVDVGSYPVDWVIVGCESGPNAREMKYEWWNDIISQCKGRRIPVFLKQIKTEFGLVKEPSTLRWGQVLEFPF